ncbi:MAG: glycosyltransferase [Thermodesulfobacteriota bacterium]|jgi:GT2 family glycosyltransferase
MDISVILATYHRPEILNRTLESFCSLDTHTLKWEVLVIDNVYDIKTREVVNNYRNKLPIKYLLESKRGKSNAVNKAIEVAKGILFVFTDDDVIADRNWLKEMWEGSKRWPDYSVFGGKILPKFPEGKKILISEKTSFFKGAYVVGDWKIDEGPYEAKNVWGPNMGIRTSIFHQGWRFNPCVGPNGDNYITGDETELTTRLEKEGIEAVFIPKSIVYHQIRSEQLEREWLCRRAFINGRTEVWNSGRVRVPLLLGVPRFLVRALMETYVKRMIYFFKKERSIEMAIEYWRIKGKIYQYKENTLKTFDTKIRSSKS